MLTPTPPHAENVFLILDGGVSLIGIAIAYAFPSMGLGFFRRIEKAFMPLARKKDLAAAVVGLLVILFRLAILPVYSIPLPFVPDDFSFLLAAETFASGHLANPTPAMWIHFESIHITMLPTYQSMYFPGQGLVLAAGAVLFGHPWFGLLIVDAVMCACLVWALQAWLPSGWALLGGLIAVVRLGLYSDWINTYHTGGSLAALGGALVIGALPRLMKTARFRYGLLMGLGIAFLILTRPYEGFLLCVPVAVVLGHWAWKGKNRPAPSVLLRRAAIPLAVMVSAVAWMGYYDFKAFGNPLTLPYTVDRNTYAITPYYVWQHQRPTPVYHNEAMRRFYTHDEYQFYNALRSTPGGFVSNTVLKIFVTFLFYGGFTLFFPLIMIRRAYLDKRIRLLWVCCFVLLAGMAIEIYLLPHYVAPFTAIFYVIGLQCMRHLRVSKSLGRPAGLTAVRSLVIVILVMAGARLFVRQLHMVPAEWPPSNWNFTWFGPEHFGVERAQVESQLERLPGPQLAIVRYGPKHEDLDEWVYNHPDIDASKVVWARELDSDDNKKLIGYYRNRTAWLVEPDRRPVRVTPYTVQNAVVTSAH